MQTYHQDMMPENNDLLATPSCSSDTESFNSDSDSVPTTPEIDGKSLRPGYSYGSRSGSIDSWIMDKNAANESSPYFPCSLDEFVDDEWMHEKNRPKTDPLERQDVSRDSIDIDIRSAVVPCMVTAASTLLCVALPLVDIAVPRSPVPLVKAESLKSGLVQGALSVLSLNSIHGEPSRLAIPLALSWMLTLSKQKPDTSLFRRISGIAAESVAIVAVRAVCSLIFGRAMGWAYPILFSNASIHDKNPGVFASLFAESLFGLFSSAHDSSQAMALFVAAVAAVAVLHFGSAWWFVSASLVRLGCLLWSKKEYVVSRIHSRQEPLSSVARLGRSLELTSRFSVLMNEQASKPGAFSLRSFRLWSLFFAGLTLLSLPRSTSVASPFEMIHSIYPESPVLANILMLTAPRAGNPGFLLDSVASWLETLPEPSDSMASRFRLTVYTHWSDHIRFDEARDYFSSSPRYSEKASYYIDWHRDPRSENVFNHTLHLTRATQYVSGSAAFTLLTEDDFPLCSSSYDTFASWTEHPSPEYMTRDWYGTRKALATAFVDSYSALPGQETCGVFFATGASGLAIRSTVADSLPDLLESPYSSQESPDVSIQECLRGRSPHPACASCKSASGMSGLVVVPRLMQRHLGYNTSTLEGREYGQEEWACGWRQPFNGDLDTYVLDVEM